MKKLTMEEYEKKFKSEVYDRSDVIDTHGNEDWHSLTLGWALAMGMTPDEAYDFSRKVRYE